MSDPLVNYRSAQLKPCPFCGRRPVFRRVIGRLWWQVWCKTSADLHVRRNGVVHKHQASVAGRTKASAFKRWNTRRGTP